MVHGVSIGSGWQPWGRRREKTGGPVTWVGGSSLPFWCPQIKVGLWRCSDIDTRAQILEACGGQAGRQALWDSLLCPTVRPLTGFLGQGAQPAQAAHTPLWAVSSGIKDAFSIDFQAKRGCQTCKASSHIFCRGSRTSCSR